MTTAADQTSDEPTPAVADVAATSDTLEPDHAAPVVRPRGDVVALGVAVLVPLVGIVLTLATETWLTVAFLMLVPAIAVVYGLGLLVFVRVLRRRSMLRRELGSVPRRYRAYAWVWALAFLVTALSPTLGGFDLPWALQAGLVAVSAVAVGAVTGAVWSTYLRDVAWVNAPRED